MSAVAMWMLPWLVAALTPVLVAAVKVLATQIQLKLPKSMLPVLAAAIGEAMNQVGPMLAGIPGLPPGLAGLAGVGLRELYDQLSGNAETSPRGM